MFARRTILLANCQRSLSDYLLPHSRERIPVMDAVYAKKKPCRHAEFTAWSDNWTHIIQRLNPQLTFKVARALGWWIDSYDGTESPHYSVTV